MRSLKYSHHSSNFDMRFFNRVILQTPESVELEFTLAGIGNRAYALFVDYLLSGFIIAVFLSAWTYFSIQFYSIIGNWLGMTNQLGQWLIAIPILTSFFIYIGYFVFFEALWQGQTPGKRYVKIRVIRDDGRSISLQQSTLRALLRPIDDTFFIGVFLIVLSKREKRLGDYFAGTLVIQEERSFVAATFPLSEPAQDLANQLQLEADLSRMLPEDFAVIRQYLQRRQVMTKEAKNEVSKQLADQIIEIIALEQVPQKVTANVFLEAVYLAYQQQSSKQ